MSFKFETVAKEFLIRKNKGRKAEDVFYEIGRYWGNNPQLKQEVEIDIVTRMLSGMVVYECKWTNDLFRLNVVNNLKSKSSHLSPKAFGGFARNDYSQEAKDALDVYYNVDDLYALDKRNEVLRL